MSSLQPSHVSKVAPGEVTELDDVRVTAVNSGHMLGSVQFLVELPEQTILYTGDLNCVDTLTTRAAAAIECDTVIMEATYGSLYYLFPDRTKLYARIVEWVIEKAKSGLTPCFHVYSAGKAQELIRLFNLYTTIPVYCDRLVSGVNIIHNRTQPLEWKSMSGEFPKPPALIVAAPSANIKGKVALAKATGWALTASSRKSTGFPLSSHADFHQLVEFVRATKAKRAFFFTGFTEEISSYVRRKFDIYARPLPSLDQRRISEY